MSAKNNEILEDVHPLTIIREVQKWPVLYSRDSRERGNVHLKTKVWYEVAKAVFTNWDSYSDTEKDCKVIDLNKRWRNLRDNFKRQVKVEKKTREGKESKRKTYVYFKHMLFLLPHVSSSDDTKVDDPKLEAYFKKKKTKKGEERSNKRKMEQHFIDETPISIPRMSLKTCETDEIDEDRHFALSLIPTLKKMSDDEKLIAKMEILKVLRKVRIQSREKAENLVYCVEEVGSSGGVKIEIQEDGGEETTNMSAGSDNSE